MYSEFPKNLFFRKLIRLVNLNFFYGKDICLKVHKHRMYANRLDGIWVLLLWKFFLLEGFETKLMYKTVKKEMVVFDIGANIGYYTLIFADLVGKKGKVYAFEPDPTNYKLLLKNIKLNNYNNIKPIRKAVSNKIGRTDFFLSDVYAGEHSISNINNEKNVIKVEITTLDKFANSKIKPDIIKIDIEGAESLAVSGMDNLIKTNKDMIIICEFWPKAMIKSKSSPMKFLNKLENYGFKIKLIDEIRERVEPINSSSLMNKCKGNKYVNLFLKR